ncbi:hypothetical protein Ndes2437B_g00514, partial [Nannochloris sp. 'desiccata']
MLASSLAGSHKKLRATYIVVPREDKTAEKRFESFE